MKKPLTRKEACETYDQKWIRQHLTAEQWDEVLDLLYEGKWPSEIIRALKLDPKCNSSLTAHVRRHRGYIAFMRGVRLKDKRLQLAATLSDAWRALIEKVFEIAMDESTKPGMRIKAATVAQREVSELQRLAQATVEEFQREEHEQSADVTDVKALVQRIAEDVYGIRRNDGGTV